MATVTLDSPVHEPGRRPAEHVEDRSAVDIIERAVTAHPLCFCGRPTRVVERDGALRLQCSLITVPAGGPFGRLMDLVTGALHMNDHLVDVPETVPGDVSDTVPTPREPALA